MKTKTLIITAALVVASAPSSLAQVYSANAVGYVTMNLPAGFSLIANPLNNGDNHLNTLLPLPREGNGAIIWRFVTDTNSPLYQHYGEYIQFIFPDPPYPGPGFWFTNDPDPNWLVLRPGEGFFIQCLQPLNNVRFFDDVSQGHLSNTMPTELYQGVPPKSIRASQVPQQAPLGHVADNTGPKSGLEFPALTGDTVFLWDVATQNYQPEPYQYLEGLGWLQGANIVPDGPTIPVGIAFSV